MKLYTLDYNCNQPLTQQVNIATNTDAKIGIKVQKDGEYINLDSSTLSVVTPNTTISADAELTNGYVTFPITTPDTGSLVQDTVVVDIKENPTEYKASQAIPIPDFVKSYIAGILATTLSSSVGQRVYAEDIDLFYGVDAAATSGTELTGYNGDAYLVQVLDSNILPIYSGWHATSTGIDKHWWKLDSTFNPIGEPLDFVVLEEGQSIRLIVSNKSKTLPAYASTEKYTHIKVVTKTEATKEQFKLNINTFKSQQGDKEYIKELPYIPSETINIAGTYTDNTPFSYDVFINEQ